MKNNNKFCIILLIILICSNNQIITQEKSTYKIANSGRDRVFTIMYDGEQGINNYNRKITYAQTKNLVEDVVLPQIALYFQTHTELGQTFLFDTLSSVVSPKDTNNTIMNRAHNIKTMVENENLQKELQAILAPLKEHVAAVMQLMTNRDHLLEQIKIPDLSKDGMLGSIVKPWFVLNNYIARNPWWNLSSEVYKTFQAALLAGAAGFQTQSAYNKFLQPEFRWTDPEKMKASFAARGLVPNKNNIWTTADPSNFWTTNPQKLFFDAYTIERPSLFSDTTERLKFEKENALKQLEIYGLGTSGYLSEAGNETAALLTTASAMGSAAYYKGKDIYNNYKDGIEKRNLIHSLYTLIDAAEKLEQLCNQYHITLQFRPSFMQNKEGLAMIEELKSARYKEKNSSLVITPWVHTFVTQIYEQDTHFAPFFACIAEIDTYHALATKMIESQTSSNKLCFSLMLSENKPQFDAQGFWNIIMSHPVPNTIHENRNIIITGPNAGGKSTFMRAILQNFILSQTFGIATGTSFKFTPYDVIHSYLNVKDNPTERLSRYAAELKLAVDIVNQAKTLDKNEKFFFILDELFTSTGGKDGEAVAYEFVHDDLAPFKNKIQFIFATHFEKLKTIGTANPKDFANYKVDAPTRNSQNQFVYPFTVSPGVSTINIAQQLKKDAGLLGAHKIA